MTILKRGYLYKLPRSGMIKHWNKRWMVLHSSSREGNLRMEYYDNESHETREIQKRIIPLDGCHAISQIDPMKSKKHVFDFTTKLGRIVFAADTQEELEDWIKSLKTAVQFDLELKKQKKLGFSLKDQITVSTDNELEAESTIYQPPQTGKYEVLVEPNEDSDRLELEGKYLLVVSLEDVKLVKPENGQVFAQWEYKHLKKYGKSTGKFNLECGRASRTGPGKFIFVTNEGRNIFTHIHGNIQTLGNKKEEGSDTLGVQSPTKPLPQSSSARNSSKKSQEAPAAIGKTSIPEYAVVDKSKKKKKRSSLMVSSSHDKDIATTTGVKAGVFRKLDENVYDTPIIDSIKPKQQPAEQKPADESGYSLPSFFDSAPTKTVMSADTHNQQQQDAMDTPFGDEDPFAGYSVPAFDVEPPTQAPAKVKPTGKNPFFDDDDDDDARYETPMISDDQPMKWQESKFVQPTTQSKTKEAVTGDYDVPPELDDDELVAFSNNPFSNSSNTYSSPFDKKQDYVNIPTLDQKRDYSNDTAHVPSYSSTNDGTTTTTALSFDSDEDDDGAVINPLLNVEEDFGSYLGTGGDDDMWADLIKQNFN